MNDLNRRHSKMDLQHCYVSFAAILWFALSILPPTPVFAQADTQQLLLRLQIDTVEQWLIASTAGLNAYELNRNDNIGTRAVGATVEFLSGELRTLENLRRDISAAQALVHRARAAQRANQNAEAQRLSVEADQRSHDIRARTTAFLASIEVGGQRGINITGFAPAAACFVYVTPIVAGAVALHAAGGIVGAALLTLDNSTPAPLQASTTTVPEDLPHQDKPTTNAAAPAGLPAPSVRGAPTAASNTVNPRAAQLQRMLAAYRRLVANQEASLRQMRTRSLDEPVRLRLQTELIEAARQGAIRWRQEGAPGLDWTQFLIESHGQLTQTARLAMRPPRQLNSLEYQGWNTRWQTLSTTMKNALSEAQRQNWDLAYDTLHVQLTTARRRIPRRENINIIDCIQGRFTNAQCEAHLIWGVLHQLSLRPPADNDFKPALEVRAEVAVPSDLTAQRLAQPPVINSVSWNSRSQFLRRPLAQLENGSTRGDLYQPSLLALSFIEQRHGELPFQAGEILLTRRTVPAPVPVIASAPRPNAGPGPTQNPAPAPSSTPQATRAPEPQNQPPSTTEFLSRLRLILQNTDPTSVLASLRQLATIPETALNQIMTDAIAHHGSALAALLPLAQRLNFDVIRHTIALARVQIQGPELERLSGLGQRLMDSIQAAPGASLLLLRNASAILALREHFSPLLAELSPPAPVTAEAPSESSSPTQTTAAEEAAATDRARRALAEINAAGGGRDQNHTMTRLIQTTGALGPRMVSLAIRNLSRLDPAALTQGLSMMSQTNPQMLQEIINQVQNLTPDQMAQLAEHAASQERQVAGQASQGEGNASAAQSPGLTLEQNQRRCDAIFNTMTDQEKMEFTLTVKILLTRAASSIHWAPLPAWLNTRVLPSGNAMFRWSLLPTRIQTLLGTTGLDSCPNAVGQMEQVARDRIAENPSAAEHFTRTFLMESISIFLQQQLELPINVRHAPDKLSHILGTCSVITAFWPNSILPGSQGPPGSISEGAEVINPWCSNHPLVPQVRQHLRAQAAASLIGIPQHNGQYIYSIGSGNVGYIASSFFSPQNLLPLVSSLQRASPLEQDESAAVQAAENILRELWADQSGQTFQQTLNFAAHNGNYGDRATGSEIERFHHPETFCREFYRPMNYATNLEPPIDYRRFVENCTHTPEALRITAMINRFRTTFSENPAIAFSDRTERANQFPTQVMQLSASLYRVPERAASLDRRYLPAAPTPTPTMATTAGTPAEQPYHSNRMFLEFLADSRRLGALPPPPRLPPLQNRPALTTTTATVPSPLEQIQLPPAVTDDTALLTAPSNPQTPGADSPGSMQLLLVPAPAAPQAQQPPEPTAAQRRREAAALAPYQPRPGRLQLPMARLLNVLFEFSSHDFEQSPLRRRWNAHFLREIINAAESDPGFRRANNTNPQANWGDVEDRFSSRVLELARLSPGPIPGPFRQNISRDYARLIYLFLSRNSHLLNRIRANFNHYQNHAGAPNDMYFENLDRYVAFINQINSMFGPPHISTSLSPSLPNPVRTPTAVLQQRR